MRAIDQLKIDRIHKAAMDIVYTQGFDHISLRQIAEMEKVSPGAPYVYYKDKQDLITNLFYLCLEYVSEGLQDTIDSADSLKEKLYACIFNLVCKYCDIPLMVKYVLKFRNHPELFTDEPRRRYFAAYLPLVDLCKAAIAAGQVKTSDLTLMHAMLFSPVMQLFDAYEGSENQFDPRAYEECVRLSVDSVLF